MWITLTGHGNMANEMDNINMINLSKITCFESPK